jgi:N-acetylneuraminic acid mutarotase
MALRNATSFRSRAIWLGSALLVAALAACSDDDPGSGAGTGGMAGTNAMGGASGAAGGGGSSGGQGGASGAAGSSGGQGGMGSGGAGATGGSGGSAGTMSDAGMNDAAMPEPDATVPLPTMWSTGMVMPTIRTELAVAEHGGRIYVAGGYGGPSAFEGYDPDSNAWVQLADLPVPLDHPSLAAGGGLIYLTGGDGAALYSYDPAKDEWVDRPPMIYPRYAAAMVALGDELFVIGGTGPADTVLQRYNRLSGEWSEGAELSVTRDHVAAVVRDGKIYALGGRAGLGVMHTSVEIYDPVANTWTPGTAMQESRSGFGAAVIGGQIYVAGGEVLELPAFSVRDTVERFDPAAGQWHFEAPLPSPLHGIGATTWDGRFLIFGGASEPAAADPRTGIVHIYGP